VPRLLSLPERERKYLKGLKGALEKRLASETDEQAKAELAEQIKKVDASLKSLDAGIDVVGIIEKTEGK